MKNSVIYPGRRNLMYTVMAWQEYYLGILRRAIAEAEVFSAGTDISLGWGRQDEVRYIKSTEVLGA